MNRAARWCGRCRQAHQGPCPQSRRESQRAYDATREGGRYGDVRWRAFRKAYLAQHPLCADCLPVVTAATDVHHVVKLRDGGDQYDPGNCMALCHACHAVRTGRGE